MFWVGLIVLDVKRQTIKKDERFVMSVKDGMAQLLHQYVDQSQKKLLACRG